MDFLAQALGNLTSLRQLNFKHLEVDYPDTLPLPAVRPLSAITRLERLELRLRASEGELPANLLPALGSLISLQLELYEQSVAWQCSDGRGPMLRQLELVTCRVGLPPDRLLPALWQLERLELEGLRLEEAQFSVLPQLPRLTSLALCHMGAAWPSVLRCAMLRELTVREAANPPPADLPPGSLSRLTRLTIACAHASPAWLMRPQLRSLNLSSSRCVLLSRPGGWRVRPCTEPHSAASRLHPAPA